LGPDLGELSIKAAKDMPREQGGESGYVTKDMGMI